MARIGVAANKERAVARANHTTTEGPRGSTPYATFDRQGLVFALTAGHHKTSLFDVRQYQHGEFAQFNLQKYVKTPKQCITKGLRFSPCGKNLLAWTDDCQLFSVDSFDGSLVRAHCLFFEFTCSLFSTLITPPPLSVTLAAVLPTHSLTVRALSPFGAPIRST